MATMRITRKQNISKNLITTRERNQGVVKSCTIKQLSCTFYFEAVQVKTHIQGFGLFF